MIKDKLPPFIHYLNGIFKLYNLYHFSITFKTLERKVFLWSITKFTKNKKKFLFIFNVRIIFYNS